jgi:hypothetical protein
VDPGVEAELRLYLIGVAWTILDDSSATADVPTELVDQLRAWFGAHMTHFGKIAHEHNTAKAYARLVDTIIAKQLEALEVAKNQGWGTPELWSSLEEVIKGDRTALAELRRGSGARTGPPPASPSQPPRA